MTRRIAVALHPEPLPQPEHRQLLDQFGSGPMLKNYQKGIQLAED